MGKAERVVILPADDWACIFVLLVVQMRRPAQSTTGDWVMVGLVFKWFPLWEFSPFDIPLGQEFSGSLGSWSQCSHSKGSWLDLWSGTKIPQVVYYDIKANIKK